MKLVSESKYIEKKSKFFGYLYSIENEKEIKEIVNLISFRHKKSKHICYSAILDNEEIIKNDGEVGSPGKVLLQILKDNNLNSHLLVIARIFGGIKLGVGGVSRAFRECAKECLKNK